jgi:hypothetical protein
VPTPLHVCPTQDRPTIMEKSHAPVINPELWPAEITRPLVPTLYANRAALPRAISPSL